MALLIAVSKRHLEEAAMICRRSGAVALPLLSAGDLVSASAGTHVFVLAAAEGDEEMRAVSWRATLVSWTEERPASEAPSTVDRPGSSGTALRPSRRGDEDGWAGDEPDQEDEVDPIWIVISELHELPLHERIHTNELVRKQDRGARFFVPRAPRLVHVPE